MQPLDAQSFGPPPATDFRTYPGPRHPGPFVYDAERVWPLPADDAVEAAAGWLRSRGRTPLNRRRALVCSGSNASPPQVRHKARGLAGDGATPFLEVELLGARPVYAGHVAAYGAIPASMEEAPGGASRLFLGLYTEEQLDRVIASEHGNYRLCRLDAARLRLAGGRETVPPVAFLSARGVLTLDGGAPLPLEEHDQVGLLERLVAALPAGAAPATEEYLRRPRRHRARLQRALSRHGLARRHRVPHTAIDRRQIPRLEG